MGTCLSKKKGSATASNAVSTAPVQIQTPSQLKISGNGVTITLSKPTNPKLILKKEKKRAQETQQQESDQLVAPQECDQTQVKKEIFIIKHRKSHDESKEKGSKILPFSAQQNVSPHSDDGLPSNAATKIAPSTPNNIGVNVRTSSCTKEEVDAILIQCGRLSRSSSGRAATSSSAGGRKYSGSKRSFDFDHCDNNDANSADDDQRRANSVSATDNSDLCEDYDGVAAEKRHHRHQHRHRHRQSPRPSPSRRRTPSRERDQQHQQRSSSRERRVSRSPGRRSSETNSTANGANASNAGNNGNNNNNNSNNNTGSRPGKLVSVPATVSSLVMDKSNNSVGGGESAAATGVKRITVKRNVGDCGVVGSRGSASPRSQSPARGNGNAANAKVVSDNHQHQQQQQQPSLSRNNSARKAEHSPYRRNPLSEIDPNSLAYPQPNTNNGSSKVQNKPKKETEAEANQNPYALEKGVSVNCKTKEQQEEEIKVVASMNDNVVVKTMVPSGAENLKPQTLTRSRSSRRSRDLDLNPEALLNNQTQSYTSLLLEDIQNFHQKNTQPSISLPACLSKACSILEAVADLNSTTSTNFSGAFSDDKRISPASYRNEHNAASLGANNHYYGKNRVADTKDPFVESEVHVNDDVMEPSLHKYVTVKRGGSVRGVVDMEDQESSGSNSFTVSTNSGQQQQHMGICISSSSWEPNSADSTDCWTSRLMEGSDAVAEARKALNCKRRDCDDHQHSSGIGRGRLSGSSSSNKGLHHTLPVVTAAAAST